jgi:hypothetical protein
MEAGCFQPSHSSSQGGLLPFAHSNWFRSDRKWTAIVTQRLLRSHLAKMGDMLSIWWYSLVSIASQFLVLCFKPAVLRISSPRFTLGDLHSSKCSSYQWSRTRHHWLKWSTFGIFGPMEYSSYSFWRCFPGSDRSLNSDSPSYSPIYYFFWVSSQSLDFRLQKCGSKEDLDPISWR